MTAYCGTCGALDHLCSCPKLPQLMGNSSNYTLHGAAPRPDPESGEQPDDRTTGQYATFLFWLADLTDVMLAPDLRNELRNIGAWIDQYYARLAQAEAERDAAREDSERLRAERELIADDTCFWYEEGGSPFLKTADDSAPRAIKPVIKICVNANDAFSWGTADAEDIPDDQFWRLYRIWQQFGSAGAIAWAMEQRGVTKLFMKYKEPFESQLQAAIRALPAIDAARSAK